MQYEKVSNEVASGEVANLYTIRWGLPARFAPVIGTYGSLGVRRFGTFGGAASKNLGIYLQDSWSVLPNLTLNIGVRTEQEEVPNYGVAANGVENAWEFDFGDKIAPRLGFAWDVMSDQKLKVYGSWGYYYDISKLNIRGSFGGDKWIEYHVPAQHPRLGDDPGRGQLHQLDQRRFHQSVPGVRNSGDDTTCGSRPTRPIRCSASIPTSSRSSRRSSRSARTTS